MSAMSASTSPPDPLPLVPDDDEQLTVASLLQERIMRSAAPTLLDAAIAQRRIAWCLPWERALATTDALADVIVFATADQVELDGLQTLARRRAIAVVVASAMPL